MRVHSIGCADMPEREKRSEIKSAADPNYDPSYGQNDPNQQKFLGGQSFAGLRDEMNDRRRATSRRTNNDGFW